MRYEENRNVTSQQRSMNDDWLVCNIEQRVDNRRYFRLPERMYAIVHRYFSTVEPVQVLRPSGIYSTTNAFHRAEKHIIGWWMSTKTRMNQRWTLRRARLYLKFIGIVEFTRPEEFLTHDFDHAVFQLFLEGEVFAGGVQFVQQFATSRTDRRSNHVGRPARTLLLIMRKSKVAIHFVTTDSSAQRRTVEIVSKISWWQTDIHRGQGWRHSWFVDGSLRRLSQRCWLWWDTEAVVEWVQQLFNYWMRVERRLVCVLLLMKYAEFSFLNDRSVEHDINGDVRTMINVLLSFCCRWRRIFSWFCFLKMKSHKV